MLGTNHVVQRTVRWFPGHAQAASQRGKSARHCTTTKARCLTATSLI